MFYFNSVQEGLDYLFTDEFGNNNVTTLHIEGSNEPWFYAHQIRDCLGTNQQARDMIRAIPDDMVGAGISRVNLNDGRVQDREVIILSLTGLLWLVGASRAPRAEKFKRWVYGVLVVGLYNHPEIVNKLNNEHKKQMCHIIDKSKYPYNDYETLKNEIPELRIERDNLINRLAYLEKTSFNPISIFLDNE